MQIPNKIDWKRGMEIMPETFISADGYHDSLSTINRQLLVPFTYGLVPLHRFELKYTIEGNRLTLAKVACTILDCEGNLLQLTQGTAVPLPTGAPGTYYLAVSSGEANHTEKNGVPQLERTYKFQIINLMNPNSPSLFPLMKLHADHGGWKVMDFIPPCCAVSAHPELANLTSQCKQGLGKVLSITEEKGNREAYYQVGCLLVELSNSARSDTPSMLVSRLKKAVFILKSEHLLDEENADLLKRADEFVWKEYTPNMLFETLQEALSFINAALEFLQRVKPVPVPVVEKPKPEPEEEEFTYML